MFTTKTKTPTTKCGFCSTGHHENCPSGTRNGNGSIHQCRCGCERSTQVKCTDCNSRDPQEVNPETWKCIDRDGCAARIETALNANPTVVKIRQIQASSRERIAAERADLREKKATHALRVVATSGDEQPPAPTPAPRSTRVRAPKSPRPCTCGCGATTKGGLFQPGHDSKYLSQLVALAETDRESAVTKATQVSETFAAKLERKLK